MVGAQASQQQYEKILSYLDIAQQEGAELLAGGSVEKLEGNLASGYYIQPTLLKGHNKMRVFQEEIFGPVVGVTTFKDEAEALAIANDTEYGLGAGLWTRDINRAYRMGRGIKAGRVWTNCYHLPGPRRVRRLQEVRRRSRDAQDDARPLPADQEPAGELRHRPAGLLLSGPQPPRIAPTRGLSAKAPAGALVPRPDAAFPMAGSGATRPWPLFRLAAAPAWTRLLPCTRANQGAQRRSPGEPWAEQAVPTKSGENSFESLIRSEPR